GARAARGARRGGRRRGRPPPGGGAAPPAGGWAPPPPRLVELAAELSAQLLDPRDVAAERIDALGHRGQLDPARGHLGDERGLGFPVRGQRAAHHGELLVEPLLALERGGELALDVAEPRGGLRPLRLDLLYLEADRVEVAANALFLARHRLGVLFAGEAGCLLRLAAGPQHGLARAQLAHHSVERLDAVAGGLDL